MIFCDLINCKHVQKDEDCGSIESLDNSENAHKKPKRKPIGKKDKKVMLGAVLRKIVCQIKTVLKTNNISRSQRSYTILAAE